MKEVKNAVHHMKCFPPGPILRIFTPTALNVGHMAEPDAIRPFLERRARYLKELSPVVTRPAYRDAMLIVVRPTREGLGFQAAFVM